MIPIDEPAAAAGDPANPAASAPAATAPIAGEGKYQMAMLRKELDEFRQKNEVQEAEIKRLRQKLIDKHAERKADDGEGEGGDVTPLRKPSSTLADAAQKAGAAARDEEIKKLTAEAADLRDKFLRARAELENVVRRTEKEKADATKYAISDFARDVLGIGDNIQRAIAAVPADAATDDSALTSFLEGIQMLERELLAMLERYGVTRQDPQGQRFDPNQHQAVMELEDADVPQGTIVQVFQAGFTIADRVLRPAIVAVSRGGAKVAKPAAPAEESAAAANAAGFDLDGDDPLADGPIL
jgi:molecular chaperone GrpE